MANELNFTGTFWRGPAGPPLEGASLPTAATIAVTHPIHEITGTTQVDLITMPFTGFRGMVLLKPTGAAALTSGGTASGNSKPIKVTYTTVANRPIWLYCDGDFWYPMAIA